MEEKTRISYYVEGNTVRPLASPYWEPIPQEQPVAPQTQERSKKRVGYQTRKNRAAHRRMGIVSLVFLATLTGLVCLACVGYVQAKAQTIAARKTMETLESTWQTLKAENNALQVKLDASVDLEEIYRVATEELGMIYPGNDQVIYYDKTESGYVRQNADIPTD